MSDFFIDLLLGNSQSVLFPLKESVAIYIVG